MEGEKVGTQILETNGMEFATLVSRDWVRVYIHAVRIQSTKRWPWNNAGEFLFLFI